MHHGNDPRQEPTFARRFRDLEAQERQQREATEMRFGATGEFPGGKLNENDEGEIQFGVALDLDLGKVVINFGKPVAWMATDGEQAVSLGELLVRHGKRLLKK